MLSATRNSRSARHDTGLRETHVDGGTSRWRPRRRRRPRPPPSFLAAAAAYPSDNDGFTIALGAQCGLRVPRLILGTMQFGEALGPGEAHAIMTAAAEEGQAALAAAAAGGNNSKSPFLALDTAEAYPVPMAGRTSGDSERIIGDWLRAGSAPGKGSSRRERTVLITKVSGPGDQPWIRGGPPRLDGDHFKRALEGSLRRLRVDELDLVMLHWPDRYVPMFGEVEFDPTRSFFPAGKTGRGGGGGGENDVDDENDDEDDDDDDDGFAEAERHFEDVLCAAFDAVSAGKLRAVGLSNETPTGLLAAASASRRGRWRERRRRGEEEEGEGEEGGGGRKRQRQKGKKRLLLFPGVAAVSNAYSLLARNFDSNGMAEACEATRVPLLGYGPLAAGLLSGKYRRGEAPPEGTRLAAWGSRGAAALSDRNFDKVEKLEAWANARGHTILDLAFAWLLGHPVVSSVIAGATSPEQVQANAATAAWALTPEEVADVSDLVA